MDAGTPFVVDGIVELRLDAMTAVAVAIGVTSGRDEAAIGDFVFVNGPNTRGGLASGVEGSTRLVDNKVVVIGINAMGAFAFGADSAVIGDGVVPPYGPNAIGTLALGVDVAAVGDGVVTKDGNALGNRAFGGDAAAVGDGIFVTGSNAFGNSCGVDGCG